MEDSANNNLPFVRLLVPAGAGILSGWFTPIGWGYLTVALVIVWVTALFVRGEKVAGVYMWLSVMLFFGAVTAYTGQGRDKDIPSGQGIIAEVSVLEEPVTTGRWTRAAGYVTAYIPEGLNSTGEGAQDWTAAGFGIQLYVDTSCVLTPGERLVVSGPFYPFDGGNGSYEGLMIRRGTAGRMFVGADGIIASAGTAGEGISLAGRLHNAAVRKFAVLPSGGLTGVAAAMVTGDKRSIPGEVRQSYTAGGGAHLLAVSGLHVGIVFVIVNILLYFIPSVRRGHIIKNIVAVVVVWLFAVAAGLSPSVLRSALMFSFAQFALARGTARSAVNIVAASAFLMLAVKPAMAADPSFVLSYAAVLSIVLFFGPVFKLIRTGNRFADGVLSVYIVGLAASLAAAPFVSYWFGSVPVAGILVNPLVLLTAHIIVSVGVLWLVWPFGFGGGVFAKVLGWAEWCQNRIMEWCAGMEWGIIEVRLTLCMAILAYTLVILSAVYLRRYTVARAKTLSLPA